MSEVGAVDAVTLEKWRRFDTAALHAALDERRRERGMSWAQVAEETQVAAATIARMPKGGRMELDGVMFMLQWLGMPAEAFLRPS